VDNARQKTLLVNRWDNLPELEAVRVFAAVAELRSFRGAASALRLPRSTVSRRLGTLESSLRTRLLQRTTRHVSLTEAGEAFLKRITPALAMIGDAGRSILDAHAEPRGLLRLTATPAMAETVGTILLELLARYPHVRLELDFTDRQVDLVAEGFDIAIRAGVLGDSSLMARPLSAGTAGYFASPAYLKERRRPKVPRDLLKHDGIVFAGSSRGARWRFESKKHGEQEVVVPTRIVANSLLLVRQAATAGFGVAWMPESFAQPEIARGELVPVLADYWPAPIPLQLVYPSARHLAPQVRAALDLLARRLKPA
jgi:DNA-binding transcriptional LysR family regulator